jgi:hypothetical protein
LVNAIEGIAAIAGYAYLRFFPNHWARGVVIPLVFMASALDAMVRLALGLDLHVAHGFWYGILVSAIEAEREKHPVA